MIQKISFPSLLVIMLASIYISCGKGSDTPAPPPNPCAGVTISVTGAVAETATGQSNGSITATASGGTGFTFKLNSGAFQSSGSFNNLAAGNYIVTARSGVGCEGSASFTVTTTNVCAGTTINVSTTTANATPCTSPANGSITVTASGITGFTYSINGTAFQSGNSFANVAAGNYTVTVKNTLGCTQTANAVVASAPSGAKFADVKAIIQTHCLGCHGGPGSMGGLNLAVDCNIVANKDKIKARTVDQAGTATQMPQNTAALSLGDRQKITDWVIAGGGFTN